MTPIQALFQSRKFLVLLMDTTVSAILMIAGLIWAPTITDKIAQFIALLQPVVLMFIYAVAKEDAAEKSAPKFLDAFEELELDEEAEEE